MLAEWSLFFADSEPVAHRLKAAFPARWVRFHSLPESKRYPADENEFAILLGRQNCLLSELVGPEAKFVLLTTEYSSPSGAVEISQAEPELRLANPGGELWRTVRMGDLFEGIDEPGYWHVLASQWAWSPGVLDPILRLVADNLISNVMIVHPGCRWLFHPYDGGMDVILDSTSARDRIKASHKHWLSARPDGL